MRCGVPHTRGGGGYPSATFLSTYPPRLQMWVGCAAWKAWRETHCQLRDGPSRAKCGREGCTGKTGFGLPYLSELLPSCLAVRLGPAHLARIPLHFEVLVALGAAEVEHLRVIPDERDAVARVDGAGAEPALDETHSCYLAAPAPSRAAAAAVAASPRPPTLASANRLAASQPTGSTSEFAAAGGGVPSRG